MGSMCSSDDDNAQPDPNTQRNAKVQQAPSLSSIGDSSGSLAGMPETMTEDEIIAAFEEAAKKGLEELVIQLDQTYHDLYLLDATFDTGDNVFLTAVRNKNHKLMQYCLENGHDVKSMLITMYFLYMFFVHSFIQYLR